MAQRSGDSASGPAAPTALLRGLEGGREELEAEILNRAIAISDPREVPEPTYADGLLASVSAALDFAFEAIERGEGREPPIPVQLLAQVRLAARNGIGLDIVLRRYFAGYSLLSEFLAAAAVESGSPSDEAKRALRALSGAVERLLAVVGAEHEREAGARPRDTAQRRTELVRRLLAGELRRAPELDYELDAHHLALVGKGAGASEAIRELTAPLDRRLLLVEPAEEIVWAWLGGHRELGPDAIDELLAFNLPPCVVIGIGEPAEDLAGWRLTHRQGVAALPIAERSRDLIARYRDVALLASAIKDDLLVTSLRKLYLEPLERERDGGRAARETMRAYLAAGRNASSAAAALGVSRRTVFNRLRSIRIAVDWSLDSAAVALELAMQLQALDDSFSE